MSSLQDWATRHARTVGRTGSATGPPARPPAPQPFRLNPREQYTLDGHSRRVWSVAFGTLPDGTVVLASGSEDGTGRLWDPMTGRSLHTLTGHRDDVTAVAFGALPERLLLASGSRDGDVRLWDPNTGQCVRTLRCGPLWSVAFGTMSDGSIALASAGDDGIRLWDPATGQRIGTLAGHSGRGTSVAFGRLADGRSVLAAGAKGEGEGEVRLWDPETGRQTAVVEKGRSTTLSVAFVTRPDGSALLAAGGHSGVVLCDPVTGRIVADLRRESVGVWSVAFGSLPDGSTVLATGSIDRDVRLWSLRDCSRLSILEHPAPLNSVAFATLPDGRCVLATGCDDAKVRIWDLGDAPATSAVPPGGWQLTPDPAPLTLPGEFVLSTAFGMLPDGSTVLASGGAADPYVYLWDPVTGENRHRLAGHDGVSSLAFDTGRHGPVTLAVGSLGGAIRLWDAVSGRHLDTLEGHSRGVNAVAFGTLPDGSAVLASASDDRTIRLWEPADGRELCVLHGHEDSVWAVAFTRLADGSTVLASSSWRHDRTARLWDPVTGECLRTLPGHATGVRSLAFHQLPGGSTVLATGDAHGTVRLWDVASGRNLHTLTGHRSAIYLAFIALPDGSSLLASAESMEGTILFRDPTTGQVRHRIETTDADSASFAMRLEDDGRLRIVVGGPRFLRVHNAWLTRQAGSPYRAGVLPGEPHLRTSAAGLVALGPAGLGPPLRLLADLVAMTGGEQPANPLLASLAEHDGIRRLRGLGWPRAARVGLAALLLDDLPVDPRYTVPDERPPALLAALLGALSSPAGPAEPVTLSTDGLRAAADRVTEQTTTLLAVLGPDAVAADPVLPLRLRERVSALPPLGRRPRALLAEASGHLQQVSARASSGRLIAGTNGVSRRGTITNLLHTQLTLPEDLFQHRHVRGELLYRVHDGDVEPPLEPVAIVLDTTPPTFGPVETVLRLVAHAITVTLWSGHRGATLIGLDEPTQAVPLVRTADLIALWSGRTLQPPELATALATAAQTRARTTIVLTHHHLVREHPVLTSPQVRALTTHAPGDPPARAPGGAYHLHLPPSPNRTELSRAVLRLLTPDVSSRI